MNHNLKLNDAAAATVSAALADIDRAVGAANGAILKRIDDMSARDFDGCFSELRAYLGTIRDAGWRIEQIVFDTDADDSEYGLVDVAATAYVATGADACSPHGIVRPEVG